MRYEIHRFSIYLCGSFISKRFDSDYLVIASKRAATLAWLRLCTTTNRPQLYAMNTKTKNCISKLPKNINKMNDRENDRASIKYWPLTWWQNAINCRNTGSPTIQHEHLFSTCSVCFEHQFYDRLYGVFGDRNHFISGHFNAIEFYMPLCRTHFVVVFSSPFLMNSSLAIEQLFLKLPKIKPHGSLILFILMLI